MDEQRFLFDQLEEDAGASQEKSVEDSIYFPFRLKPKVVDPAVLKARNEQENRKGSAVFAPVYNATKQIYGSKTAVATRILAWINHPDERVPLAMLDKSNQHKAWAKALRYKHKDAIWKRALEEADEAGELWNPLIDAICSERLYYVSFSHEGPSERIKRVAEWVRSVDNPRVIERLLEFKAWELIAKVFENIRCADVEFARRATERAHQVPHLASNKNLPPSVVLELEKWALSQLDPNNEQRGYWMENVERVLGNLLRSGYSLSPETVDSLLKIGTSSGTSTFGPAYSSLVSIGYQGVALETLLSSDHPATEEHLLAILNRWKTEEVVVRKVVAHPSAGVRVWREALREQAFFYVRRVLAEVPEAAKDPEVYQNLKKSTSADVLVPLAQYADAEDFRQIFRRLAVKCPEDAVRMTREYPSRAKGLKRSDILHLLKSESRSAHVRAYLMTCLFGGVEHFRADFKKLLELDPLTAIVLLSKLDQAKLQLVDPEMLMPLFTSPDQNIRMQALTALQQLELAGSERKAERKAQVAAISR